MDDRRRFSISGAFGHVWVLLVCRLFVHVCVYYFAILECRVVVFLFLLQAPAASIITLMEAIELGGTPAGQLVAVEVEGVDGDLFLRGVVDGDTGGVKFALCDPAEALSAYLQTKRWMKAMLNDRARNAASSTALHNRTIRPLLRLPSCRLVRGCGIAIG